MKPRTCDTMTIEKQKENLLRSYRIRAKEIRQMLGDKYTTLNDYFLVFEKLGAARMISAILRTDHGEHEAALDAEMLSTEVNEAFAAMQAKNNN